MKPFTFLTLVASLLANQAAFSLSPAQGIYVGLMAGMSHGPDINFNLTTEGIPLSGQLKYNMLGGGGGAMIGYRIQKFRIEGEVFYNRIAYDKLTIGNCTLQSPTLKTPTGTCPNSVLSHVGFNGSTGVTYGLVNGYFDFLMYGSDSQVVPYVGLGIGNAKIKNSSNFTFNNNQLSVGESNTSSSYAAQGMVGISYFMDDFTWASMDYRYLTTNNVQDFASTRYAINTLNFTVNFSFDKGGMS